MHLLYVVDFDVEGVGGTDPFDRLIHFAAAWLSYGSTRAVDASELSRSGEAALPPLPETVGAFARAASWEWAQTASVRALRISVVQLLDSGVEVTTRVTIASIDERVSFRVGISREYLGGALTPIRNTSVFQPGIVASVAHDESVLLRIGAQRLDARFEMVKTLQEAEVLIEALRAPSRLPIVLVHIRSNAGRDAAYIAGRKLIGLARVVTLNFATRQAVLQALPNVAVPFGGARLVWSDVRAPGVDLEAGRIAEHDREYLRSVLMPRLAPISALTRGSDEGWRVARLAVQRAARVDANARIQLAQEAADTGAERDALLEKVGLLETELVEAQELADSYARDVETLESNATAIEDLQSQVEYWRDLYLGKFDPPVVVEADPWEEIPDLVAGADPSDVFLALTDASGSRIVFTEAAERSWQKISYPDPVDMTHKLTALARAACLLYDEDPGPIGHVDDWFKTAVGLNIATADDTIEKNKTMRYFTFEGKKRDQVPHVQVRDAVKPNEVGRIHFAFDSKGKRLIVNHVALKLYGI